MPRISQTLAEQISKKLMLKKRELQSQSNKDMREYFTEFAEKRVPKDVMDFFKKHSEYVRTTSSIYFDGKGFNKISIPLTRAIPSISPNCYYEHVDLTQEEATKGKKIYDAFEKMKEMNNELESEILQTLLNLRTFANIEKELPEAAQHLPQLGVSVLVDTAGLRKKLKAA